jgi:hypothetical protein
MMQEALQVLLQSHSLSDHRIIQMYGVPLFD